MTGGRRAPRTVSRRQMLGLGALAAVPAAAVAIMRARARNDGTPIDAAISPDGTPRRMPPANGVAVVTEGGGPVPFENGRAMLGAYLDLTGMSPQQALALRRGQLGRDERIVHLFYGWADPLPQSISYLRAGAIPMISWRGTAYADILDGSSDALVARAARNLRRLGRPTLLRWAWEMNGDWYPWGGAKNGDDTGAFVASWRRVHGIFSDQGAGNVSWVWSVNWNDSPDKSWNRYANYYPGDAYVDWVGVSGYNLHREKPGTLFDGLYAAYAPRKPIIITEVGSVDRGGRTKADWITLFQQWVRQHPAVGAVAWFDTDTHPGYHERWRIDTDPRSLAAYRAMARDPRFSG